MSAPGGLDGRQEAWASADQDSHGHIGDTLKLTAIGGWPFGRVFDKGRVARR